MGSQLEVLKAGGLESSKASLTYMCGGYFCWLLAEGLVWGCRPDTYTWPLMWPRLPYNTGPEFQEQVSKRDTSYDLASEVTRCFCHVLVVTVESLKPAHVQGHENCTPFEGRHVNKYVDMFSNQQDIHDSVSGSVTHSCSVLESACQ